jgi:hypothetical protein
VVDVDGGDSFLGSLQFYVLSCILECVYVLIQ